MYFYGNQDCVVKSTRVDCRIHSDPISVFAKRDVDHLTLARMGLSLIPLTSHGKHPPNGFTWKPYQDRGTTEDQLHRWSEKYAGCNWGLLLGRPSGVIAVDVDSAKALHWCELQGGFNQDPPVWYETGRGWQWLFRLPDDLLDVRGVTPHKGVEIRANGQYSVVPPSTHPTGKRYTWRRAPQSLESIPYAPQWVLNALTGQLEAVSPERPSPLQPTTSQVTTDPVELAGQNAKLLMMRGTRWIEASTFPKGCRNQAFYCYTLILKGAGLSKREAKMRADHWRLTHTTPVYGVFPDRSREPNDVLEKAWDVPYSLQRDRLTALRNTAGETMPESWAIELARGYPSLRARSERVHQPLFATLAKILHALVKAKAFDGMVLSHNELARLARVSAHQVAKIAGFLNQIGIRTTIRRGRSTVSLYTLKHLNLRPPQLIMCFARWRGYAMPPMVLAKRWWRICRGGMVKALNAVNAVWNRIERVWQSDERYTGEGEVESPQPRGPPTGYRPSGASTIDLRGEFALVRGAIDSSSGRLQNGSGQKMF